MKIIIRSDANVQIGTGHLMRCLALAQAWQVEGGQVIFVTACDSPGLQQRLFAEGCELVPVVQAYPEAEDWPTLASVLAAHPSAWVVVDGYHFDALYQQRIRATGHRLLVIDDIAHLPHYHADIILNQNIHAGQLQYACEPSTRLLLSTKYVLLRREFWPWRGEQRLVAPVAQRMLVTLGGSDPANVTVRVLAALLQLNRNDLEVVVVAGANNPNYAMLEAAVTKMPGSCRLVHNAGNMNELMAWAHVAIAAAGSTSWELAFMGVPTVSLIVAPNQRRSAWMMYERGIFECLGESEAISSDRIAETLMSLVNARDKRATMIQKGQKLVDGFGVSRVVKHLTQEEKYDNATRRS